MRASSSTPLSIPLERILPITQVRRELFTIADNVSKKHFRYIITDHGIPKAALLPMCDIETLSHYASPSGGASIMADAPSRGYAGALHTLSASFVADADRTTAPIDFFAKDIIRSQLTVRLIEKYHYSEHHIVIGHSIALSDHHSIEADLLLHDGNGHTLIAFFITTPDRFEKNFDTAMLDLFTLAEALHRQNNSPLRFIGYYTRLTQARNIRTFGDRVEIIDCRAYPTYQAWKDAGSPTQKNIPTSEKVLS